MNKNKTTKYLLLFIFIVGIIYFLINNTHLSYFNIDIFNSDIYNDIFFSIKRIFVGFCIASILGVILAFILGTIKKLSFVKYILELLRPIPPIARIPLAILRF
jgi:ABC-type nitrate/sulfonate/bicarbonate transport system permease component